MFGIREGQKTSLSPKGTNVIASGETRRFRTPSPYVPDRDTLPALVIRPLQGHDRLCNKNVGLHPTLLNGSLSGTPNTSPPPPIHLRTSAKEWSSSASSTELSATNTRRPRQTRHLDLSQPVMGLAYSQSGRSFAAACYNSGLIISKAQY